MLFSIDGPVVSRAATSPGRCAASASQKRSSDQFFDLLVERALDVVAAAGQRAHRAQGKALFMPGIDEFVMHRRDIRQDAQPAEGIDQLIGLKDVGGDRRAGDAVKPVAAGNEGAVDAVRLPVLAEGGIGACAKRVMQRNVFRPMHDHAAHLVARGIEIRGHLGLAVDGYSPPAGQPVKVDAQALVVKRDLDAGVHETLALHAVRDAGAAQQVDGALFENAGADAREHIVAAAALQHHGVDTRAMQQLGEQQAGGTAADDQNLGFRGNGHNGHAFMSMGCVGPGLCPRSA
jgi:hypothetical protein